MQSTKFEFKGPKSFFNIFWCDLPSVSKFFDYPGSRVFLFQTNRVTRVVEDVYFLNNFLLL